MRQHHFGKKEIGLYIILHLLHGIVSIVFSFFAAAVWSTQENVCPELQLHVCANPLFCLFRSRKLCKSDFAVHADQKSNMTPPANRDHVLFQRFPYKPGWHLRLWIYIVPYQEPSAWFLNPAVPGKLLQDMLLRSLYPDFEGNAAVCLL